ncbi:MAG: hypothetical protein M3Y57_07185 [Acidobacteriota bacterium]|nr:hypothetical protein [Acidobacteriota bacterium]
MSVLRTLQTGRSREVISDNPADLLTRLPLAEESPEARAVELLNRTGCRTWMDNTALWIGYWPDLDGPELKAAIQICVLGEPVTLCPLDASNVPEDRKHRKVPIRKSGEPFFRWLTRTATVQPVATQSDVQADGS